MLALPSSLRPSVCPSFPTFCSLRPQPGVAVRRQASWCPHRRTAWCGGGGWIESGVQGHCGHLAAWGVLAPQTQGAWPRVTRVAAGRSQRPLDWGLLPAPPVLWAVAGRPGKQGGGGRPGCAQFCLATWGPPAGADAAGCCPLCPEACGPRLGSAATRDSQGAQGIPAPLHLAGAAGGEAAATARGQGRPVSQSGLSGPWGVGSDGVRGRGWAWGARPLGGVRQPSRACWPLEQFSQPARCPGQASVGY